MAKLSLSPRNPEQEKKKKKPTQNCPSLKGPSFEVSQYLFQW